MAAFPLDEQYQFGAVHLVSDGFQIQQGSRILCKFQWTAITQLIGYRAGAGPRDLVCLDVEDCAGRKWTAHENLKNWPQLVDALPYGLRNVASMWYAKLLDPEYAGERVTVFERHNPLKKLSC